jgi:hypothetical protein
MCVRFKRWAVKFENYYTTFVGPSLKQELRQLAKPRHFELFQNPLNFMRRRTKGSNWGKMTIWCMLLSKSRKSTVKVWNAIGTKN